MEGCYVFPYGPQGVIRRLTLQGLAQRTDLIASYGPVDHYPVYLLEIGRTTKFYLVYLGTESDPTASLLVIPDYEQEAYIPDFNIDLIHDSRIINGYTNGEFGIFLPGFPLPHLELASNELDGTMDADYHEVRLMRLESDEVIRITEPSESISYDMVVLNIVDGLPAFSGTAWNLSRHGDDLHISTISRFDDRQEQRGTVILTRFFVPSTYETIWVYTAAPAQYSVGPDGVEGFPQVSQVVTETGDVIYLSTGPGGAGADFIDKQYRPLEFLDTFGFQGDRTGADAGITIPTTPNGESVVRIPPQLRTDFTFGQKLEGTSGSYYIVLPPAKLSAYYYELLGMGTYDRVQLSHGLAPIAGEAEYLTRIESEGSVLYRLTTQDRDYILYYYPNPESSLTGASLEILDQTYAVYEDGVVKDMQRGQTLQDAFQTGPPVIIIPDFANGMLGITGVEGAPNLEERTSIDGLSLYTFTTYSEPQYQAISGYLDKKLPMSNSPISLATIGGLSTEILMLGALLGNMKKLYRKQPLGFFASLRGNTDLPGENPVDGPDEADIGPRFLSKDAENGSPGDMTF